jgi:hypothetical protein
VHKHPEWMEKDSPAWVNGILSQVLKVMVIVLVGAGAVAGFLIWVLFDHSGVRESATRGTNEALAPLHRRSHLKSLAILPKYDGPRRGRAP